MISIQKIRGRKYIFVVFCLGDEWKLLLPRHISFDNFPVQPAGSFGDSWQLVQPLSNFLTCAENFFRSQTYQLNNVTLITRSLHSYILQHNSSFKLNQLIILFLHWVFSFSLETQKWRLDCVIGIFFLIETTLTRARLIVHEALCQQHLCRLSLYSLKKNLIFSLWEPFQRWGPALAIIRPWRSWWLML